MRMSRGFTLVEILVVVAIIGLLSSIVLSSLESARVRARDATRKSQVDEFKKALQLYYLYNDGKYPCSTNCPTGGGVMPFTNSSSAGSALKNGGFISSIVSDPLYSDALSQSNCNSTSNFGYCYCSKGGDSYVLTVNTEDDTKGDYSGRCNIQVGPISQCTSHVNSYASVSCSDRF